MKIKLKVGDKVNLNLSKDLTNQLSYEQNVLDAMKGELEVIRLHEEILGEGIHTFVDVKSNKTGAILSLPSFDLTKI